MGFGLPAALGVKLAHPKSTVVCVTGDGSIQMNIQELSTALQYGLPVLVLNLKQWFLRHGKTMARYDLSRPIRNPTCNHCLISSS